MNKKILISVPCFTAKGGISNYYKALLGNHNINTEYLIRGARNWPQRKGHIHEITRACIDLAGFCCKLLTGRYYAIQTTTSLGSFALIRDGLFVLMAKLIGVKVVVFFRGLDPKVQKKIEQKHLFIFKLVFFLADCMIVLSFQFKDKLKSWGYNKPVYLETTVVDTKLIKGITEKSIKLKFNNIGNKISILFLARIEKTKGIYEAVDCFNTLKKRYSGISLIVAGDGFELNNVKNYVKKNHIKDITFTGFITGEAKRAAFIQSHIYLFPSYTEGMPNSVLEAMAFGLPIVTRNVGGLVDFFKNNEHGFITESKNSEIFSKLIETLLNKKNILKSIALNNHKYATDNFTTPKVIKRLEKIYKTLL